MADSLRCCYCHRVDSNLRRCSRCYSVYYCSKGCQTMDWSEHKTNCKRTLNSSNQLATNYELPSKDASVKGYNSSRKKKMSRTQSSKTSVKTCDIELENRIIESEIKPIREADKASERFSESGKVSEYFGGVGIDSEHCNGSVSAHEFHRTAENIGKHYVGSDTDRKRSGSAEDARKSSSRIDYASEYSVGVENIGESSSGGAKDGNSFSEMDNMNQPAANTCAYCSSPGCSQKCSRCKETFFCSKLCQIKDWQSHKGTCIRALTEEEEEIMNIHEKRTKEREETLRSFQKHAGNGINTIGFRFSRKTFEGPEERMLQMPSLKQALLIATRPEGSLINAIRIARSFFPHHTIVTVFDDLPSETVFHFMRPPRTGYVLTAFMYRYHEHVMRHGVYLKDAQDKRSKVEFYLDHLGDNPYPFFTYSQVKPGGYICLINPVMHVFRDGSVGIRIDNPEEVKVMDIEMIMKLGMDKLLS